MVQFRVVRTGNGKLGRNEQYNPGKMKEEYIDIATKEEYETNVAKFIDEFKNKATDLFTVHLYNDNGMIRGYAYEDLNYNDVDCNGNFPKYEELANYKVMFDWEKVLHFRDCGMNV